MERPGLVAGGPSRGESRQLERAARMHDRGRGREPGSESRGHLRHGRVGNGEEGHLAIREGRRRLAPGDELAAMACLPEGSGQRSPEAAAADDQEVDWRSG